MLSKHGLYPATGGAQVLGVDDSTELDLILWLLWMCDGRSGTHGIARTLGVSVPRVQQVLTMMEEKSLVKRTT
jgi:aminopeptidase-like protein